MKKKVSKNKAINIYPNPGKNKLFVELQNYSNTNVQITNSEANERINV